MMGNSAQREVYEEGLERHRRLAARQREQGERQRAAAHYEKCAEILHELANLESSSQTADKRREQATQYEEAAESLRSQPSADPGSPHVDRSESSLSKATPETEDESNRQAPQGDVAGTDEDRFLSDPPDRTFADVGGMDDLVETLRDKVIDPLERTDLYERYDLGVVNGVLLYGPPGTGKTYITEALAGELDYKFIEVRATDIVSSLVGEAAQNVADLFDTALDNQPCLVFIDEIDAIAPERSGGSQKTQSERQMITQLLTSLTEIQGEDVIVVGATNIPEEIDPAAWSRFQERIEVPPPDPPAREAILRIHFRERPVLTDELDWDAIRSETEDYTARDLALVADEAARGALEDARGSEDLEYIRQPHVKRALAETDPSLADFDGYDLPDDPAS